MTDTVTFDSLIWDGMQYESEGEKRARRMPGGTAGAQNEQGEKEK